MDLDPVKVFIKAASIVLLVSVPLALWKLCEIIIWILEKICQ